MFPIIATSTVTVVIPDPMNPKAAGQSNSAEPEAGRSNIVEPDDTVALSKVAVATVPVAVYDAPREGKNVFPVKVRVAIRLLAAKSISSPTPEELLTT